MGMKGIGERTAAVENEAKVSMRVLIADDSAVYRHLVERALADKTIELVFAEDGQTAWELLQPEDGPKLVILDWEMPRIDGLELSRRIRQHKNAPYVYILLLTAKQHKERIVEAFDAGVDDYLTKPFDADELRARLRAGSRMLALHNQLISANMMLQHEATHDRLTGLLNRAGILDSLQRELERAKRGTKPVGVILADIDHFKHVNDAFGHLVGDEVLHHCARFMLSCVRTYDWVGRYGGEEFMIVFPDCGADDAMKRASQIFARIRLCLYQFFL